MKYKRHTLLILVSFICLSSNIFAQKKRKFIKRYFPVNYSSVEAQKDFQQAMSLLEQDDSINLVISRLRSVSYYDSTSVIGKQATKKLDAIWQAQKTHYEELLTGTWKWIWEGSNFGTSESLKTSNRKQYYTFEKGKLEIKEEGKETKVWTYQIDKERSRFQFSKDYTVVALYIEDLDITWGLMISKELMNFYAMSSTSENTTYFLNIKTPINCVCGCNEDVFEKVKK